MDTENDQSTADKVVPGRNLAETSSASAETGIDCPKGHSMPATENDKLDTNKHADSLPDSKNKHAKKSDDGFTVHVAIQAYDYEIERGSSVLPARRRILPSKYRDYDDPDAVDDTADEDYKPVSTTPSGRGRGRPRKNPVQVPAANGKSSGDHKGPETTSISILDNSPSRRGRRRKYKTFAEDELKEERPHRCDDCGQTFVSTNALLRHRSYKHGEYTGTSDPVTSSKSETSLISEKSLVCDLCNKKFSHIGNLKAHQRTHSTEKSFQCDVCGNGFMTAESLKRHKMSHLGIKPFACDVCEEKFSSNVALKEHKSRHTDSKPYQCDTCKRRFRQVSVYKRHLMTHSGEKPHICDLCGAAFSQAIYLRSHMKKHTGEKPHKCDLCDKRFAHASDKTRHQKTHSGEKPYKCTTCDARFTDASSCRRHIKEHLGHPSFSCDHCGETFKRKVSLKTHTARRHGPQDLKLVSDTHHGPQELKLIGDGHQELQLIRDDSRILLLSPSGQEISTLAQIVDKDGHKVLTELASSNHGDVMDPQGGELTTTQIIEEIESQFEGPEGSDDGSAGDGQVQVAYHILHEDDKQQILEIQYGGPKNYVEVQYEGQMETGESVKQEALGQQSLIVQEVTSVDAAGNNYQTIEVPALTERGLVSSEHEYAQTTTSSREQESQFVQTLEIQNSDVTFQNSDVTFQNNDVTSQDSDVTSQVVPEGSHQGAGLQEEESDQGVVEQEKSHFEDSSIYRENKMKSEPDDNQNNTENLTTLENKTSEMDSLKTSFVASASILDSEVTRTFISSPDFASQNYYNWLATFTDQCKQLTLPLSEVIFKGISHVHKTLSDIMATPKGILAHKDNFRILMSISHDLNSIISQHLLCVLQQLESNS